MPQSQSTIGFVSSSGFETQNEQLHPQLINTLASPQDPDSSARDIQPTYQHQPKLPMPLQRRAPPGKSQFAPTKYDGEKSISDEHSVSLVFRQ